MRIEINKVKPIPVNDIELFIKRITAETRKEIKENYRK